MRREREPTPADIRLEIMARLFAEGEAAGKRSAIAELAALLDKAASLEDARQELHLYAFRVLVPTTKRV